MTYRISVSTFAKSDRKGINKYLAQFSVSAPVKFKSELKRYIGIIGETPEIFSEHYANPKYRHVVVYGSYVMFYTIDEDEKVVFIYRILHGAQDIANIL